jgi:hypothetical protein
MVEKTMAERVCRTLEGLCILEWRPTEESFEDTVYRFCHLVSAPDCPAHENWLRDFEKTESLVNEAMKSPAEKERCKERQSTKSDEGIPGQCS